MSEAAKLLDSAAAVGRIEDELRATRQVLESKQRDIQYLQRQLYYDRIELSQTKSELRDLRGRASSFNVVLVRHDGFCRAMAIPPNLYRCGVYEQGDDNFPRGYPLSFDEFTADVPAFRKVTFRATGQQDEFGRAIFKED